MQYWLPSSYDACNSLPMADWRLLPESKAFVSLLVWKSALHEVDRDGYARLHSHWLRRLLGHDFARVASALMESRVAERTNYSSGLKSYGYRLASRFQSDRVVREPIEERRIIRRLTRCQEDGDRDQKRRWNQIHHELDRRHRLIAIDRATALTELEQYPDCRLQQSVLVEAIAAVGHRLTVGRASERVTTTCGLLKCCVRKSSLSSCGERLVEADLKASQPTLLAMLLVADRRQPIVQELLRGIDLPDVGWLGSDVQHFKNTLARGTVYEKLAHILRREGATALPSPLAHHSARTELCSAGEEKTPGRARALSRQQIKKHLMRDVLAKRGTYPSDVEGAFKELWPTVYEYVRLVNRQDYKRMLLILQRIEARLVSGKVCGLLVDRLPQDVGLFSIHDCVCAPVTYQSAVLEAFDDVARELGFPLNVEIKNPIETQR